MVDMLKHVADKHSNKYVQRRDSTEPAYIKEHQKHNEVLEKIEDDKFKCFKCKKIVLKCDALKTFTEEGKNICSLCTILSYGED